MSDSDEDEGLERTIKVTLVGEPSTGKSTLCARYLGTEANGSAGPASGSGTQGAEVYAGLCLSVRPPAQLQLCDVAGAALETPMLDNYLYASHIILLVYDVTNLASFDRLQHWMRKIEGAFGGRPPLLALFGNKADLEHQRAVRLSCAQRFASHHLIDNFKGSARTGEAVSSTFTALVARVLGDSVQLVAVPRARPDYATQASVAQNGRGDPTANGEPTQPLIMHRKAFRAIHRKATSSVLIEKYTDNVRFCIICNYLGKVIPALQSRCTRFRFAPLQSAQIVPRLQHVAKEEGVELSEEGVKALLTLSGGDMRKVLNTLQSTWLAYRRVTEDTVYTCVGHPLRSDISNILNWLLNETDFSTAFQRIQVLKIAKGLALSDILTELHTLVQRVMLPPAALVSLLIKMSDAEARLAAGTSENIELASLLAAFHLARDMVVPEESNANVVLD